ncbi:MAG: HAD family hydrolase [Armatimonadota bacterium]
MPTPPSNRNYLPDTRIEVINEDVVRGRVRSVLFDFDGTLSLIRAGWQDVMVPMMVDVLAQLDTGESREDLEATVREYVFRLTGKQTIYQMIQLAEEVRKRGGRPRDPVEYKHQYLDLLWEQISHRVEGLKDGSIQPEQMLLPGALAMVEQLHGRGCRLYLASGTDLPFVQDEAHALGLARYFAGEIYGAVDDYPTYSKRMIIERIIEDHRLAGPEFLAIGDGYVEIEDAKAVGGIAVGVASDELNPGQLNQWKRERLIGVGADLIVPDFREHEILVQYLFEAGGG